MLVGNFQVIFSSQFYMLGSKNFDNGFDLEKIELDY